MEMYSETYKTIRNDDPQNPLVKAMEARENAKIAFEQAMAALATAKREARKAEISHYATCMSDARLVFGYKPFTAREFEEAVGGYVSKHSIASMVAYDRTPEGAREFSNKGNRRTEVLLPSDLKDTGEHKRVEQYFLPCDASGNPIKGAEPIKKTSKGSKLYRFEV